MARELVLQLCGVYAEVVMEERWRRVHTEYLMHQALNPTNVQSFENPSRAWLWDITRIRAARVQGARGVQACILGG